jgi:hypothetical protein
MSECTTRLSAGLTVAWHVYRKIYVDIHDLSQIGVHVELIVPPAPQIVAKIVENEYKRDNRDCCAALGEKAQAHI